MGFLVALLLLLQLLLLQIATQHLRRIMKVRMWVRVPPSTPQKKTHPFRPRWQHELRESALEGPGKRLHFN